MVQNIKIKYQLNQWEANDPVLREDFNGDNVKIEAALVALRDRILSADVINAVFDKHAQRLTSLETRMTAVETRIDRYHGE